MPDIEQLNLRPLTIISLGMPNGQAIATKVYGTRDQVADRISAALAAKETVIRFLAPTQPTYPDGEKFVRLDNVNFPIIDVIEDRDIVSRIAIPSREERKH